MKFFKKIKKNKALKPPSCYYCEHCIVQDTLYDFQCDVTKHFIMKDGEETEYFAECKGKDFVKE